METVNIREITSNNINKLVSLDGIVTKITDIKPKLTMGIFECNHCGKIYEIKQDDKTKERIEPGICSCEKRSYTLLTDQSTFIDFQEMELQEPHQLLIKREKAKRITVYLEKEFTNKVVLGDKIQLIGVVRVQLQKYGRSVHTNIHKYIISNVEKIK